MAQQQNYSIPRIVISGLRGGGGKTILSLCLLALWRKKGLRAAPFKKGPDYIDAGWLAQAAGTPCFNLDLFMMSPEQVKQSFISHTNPPIPPFSKGGNGGIIAIIEGNRGLYDGVDDKGTYSTAELAKLLKAPVLLMVDCTKVTNTAAALVLGCQKIDSDVLIGGVVLNRVATARQEDVIRKAINDKCNLPVLGALPRLKKDPLPERHMGLTPFQEHLDIEKSISVIAEAGEKYLDTDGIWRVAKEAEPFRSEKIRTSQRKESRSSLKVGIIKDSAFQFYYQENIEELEKRGAQLIEVNALEETRLPDINALYIGGGFPETHAVALADNMNFKQSLYEAIEQGLPVYAECGGLMFLGKSLLLQNKTYPMVGSLPLTFSLEKKPQAHGYTIIEVEHANPYFPKNIILKGHEFHYSRVLEIKENSTYMAFKVKRGRGILDNRDGLCYKNVLASYTHLHALGASEWADGLIRCALKFKKQR